MIDRSVLPTTLSLSYLAMPSYVTLCLNLMNHYNWTRVFILWSQNSVPVYGFVAEGLSNSLSTGKGLYILRGITSTVNTTFADQLLEFKSFSRGTCIDRKSCGCGTITLFGYRIIKIFMFAVMFFFGHASKLRQLLVITIHRVNAYLLDEMVGTTALKRQNLSKQNALY